MAGPFWPGSGPGGPRRWTPSISGGYPIVRAAAQTAKARIQVDGVQRTQTAKASIGAPTSRTQTAVARIRVLRSQTQDARARIKAVATRTQTAKARIQADGVQKTQTAKARVAAPTTKTQTAKGRIQVTTQRTQTARARIGALNLAVRAPAAPALTVQYGTFTLDETNGIVIASEYTSRDDSILGDWVCRFHVRVKDETGVEDQDDATYAGLLSTVETNLRIPRQKLLVKFGTREVRNWDFTQASQTAFLIYPELSLVRENRRHATYEFRVRCQFPGNVPNNFFRRESTTQKSTSLRQNRICTISATWTSSPGKTALQNYDENGDAFFSAYLPSNGVDQYGYAGTWIRADENPVASNDERSLVHATRVYWECFNTRRDSAAKKVDTIAQRREFTAQSTWVATSGGSALQNYLAAGDAFYGKLLLDNPPAADGQWVLVDEEPTYNDQTGVLTVTRTYHECVRGNREFTVRSTQDAAGLRHLIVSGTYYQTGGISAKTNYTNDIGRLITSTVASQVPPMARYESVSIPREEGYDAVGKRYFFTWHLHELAYPQGPSTDDPDVTVNTLDIEGTFPKDPQSIPDGTTITRLQTVVARFSATINYQRNQDPAGIWNARSRQFVANAVATKLGSNLTVQVVNEKVAVGLHNNTVSGSLYLIVTGGSLLRMSVSQTRILVPGRDFAFRADGTPLSAYPYRAPSEEILRRHAEYEYVAGGADPDPFAVTISGFGMIQTDKTGQESYDEQKASGTLSLGSGWFIDRRASVPYSKMQWATTRGDDFETVTVVIEETWRKLDALEPGVTL